MISIIVPVYNAQRYLGECLDSLSGQTLRDIEILCVDDGSTDDSASILEKHALGDGRIVVLTQPNSGVSAARNHGIERARGQWLMFVDSDDLIDPDTCERALGRALEHGADVVLWSYMREFDDGRRSPRPLMRGDRKFCGEDLRRLHRKMAGPVGRELRNPALLHSWGTVWGKLYSRRVVSTTRFTDTRIVGSAEDALFNLELFDRASMAYYIDRAMYHYRKSEASLTRGYNGGLNEGWERLYRLMSDLIVARNLGDDFHSALEGRVALGLIGQGLNECRSPGSAAEKRAAIGRIISTKRYRAAIDRLPFEHFPPHWRLFFRAARNGNAALLLSLLRLIGRLK